jgi:hypothetical protein
LPLALFPGFNENTTQIIYLLNNKVYDLTHDYLQDSLRHFAAKGINSLESNGGIQYDPTHLQIIATNTDQFVMDGFYENQMASVGLVVTRALVLKAIFIAKDSLSLALNTYMPPVCKTFRPGFQ